MGLGRHQQEQKHQQEQGHQHQHQQLITSRKAGQMQAAPLQQEQPWPGNQQVHMNPWTLVFSNTPLEAGFRQHQHTIWASNELRNMYANMLAGTINLTITICLLVEGSIFTFKSAKIMLPYMTVAVLHWYLVAHWSKWPQYRDAASFIAEVLYHTICVLSMPTWVLHGVVSDIKTFLRHWILGSGILIGYWCRFLTPTFFATARWLVPLQFLFQACHLAQPTCAALQASPYGRQAARNLSSLLDEFAAAMFTMRCPVHACEHSVYLLQLVAGCTLLYSQYRMERANRLAFLQGRTHVLQREWPFMPGYAQVVLHVVVYVQLLAALWVMMQCSVATLLPAN